MAPEPPSARFEFPIMLYGMLEDCTFDNELCQIVSWQPHGLSFKIHDREGFERILPRWFKEKSSSSSSTNTNNNNNKVPVPPSRPPLPPPPPAPKVVPTPAPPAPYPDGGGCKICKKDDDHSNLLLCEGCDTESHTYCLDPPLDAVPEEDWFCGKCPHRMDRDRKELTRLIKTIPEEMRSRFGEVCFSKSGERAHFGPPCYLTHEPFCKTRMWSHCARGTWASDIWSFTFENPDAFAAVPKSWIVPWDEGVKKEYDKGKHIKSASKARQEQYQQALEAARLAMPGSTDIESKHSDSSPEESLESPHEVTPMSPLKEVEDDSVLCSKCGKVLEMAEGPVLADGYWQCHDCHKAAQALLKAKNTPPPPPSPVAVRPPSRFAPSKPLATKPKALISRLELRMRHGLRREMTPFIRLASTTRQQWKLMTRF